MSSFEITLEQLETKDLILRPFRMTDLNDFYEYARMENVGPSAGWRVHPSKEYSAKILKSIISQKDCYAIVLKAENKVIGSIGIHKRLLPEAIRPEMDPLEISKKKYAEIGYVLNPNYWQKGFMTQAVSAVIYHSFSKLKLDFLCLSHSKDNPASGRVAEKCGFRFIKEYVRDFPLLDNISRDSLFYILEFDSLWKQRRDKDFDETTIF